MLFRARQAGQGGLLEADICVVGAGAAGITIAREFAGSSLKVCVLESGGLELDERTQKLYVGKVIGHSYPPLDVSRLRYFGGTTNHWGGFCRPLDPLDFETRPYVPNSGWPFPASSLGPYYERAQRVCQLGPFAYDAGEWPMQDRRPMPLDPARITATGLFQLSPPTRFGEVYGQELAQAHNVHVWLQANLVDIETSADASSVTAVHAASLDGRRFRVSAKLFVLAAGTVENARLLLNANATVAAGLGNQHGNVGRYFMDHPMIVRSGAMTLNDPALPPSFYVKKRVAGVVSQGFFSPAAALQRERALLNCGILIEPKEFRRRAPGVAALRQILASVAQGEIPDDFAKALGEVVSDFDSVAEAAYRKLFEPPPRLYYTHFWAECPPDPESRISLTHEVDALGMRRVRLDWRLPVDFRRHYAAAHELLALELGRAGLGRLQLDEAIEDPAAAAISSDHQMGATRMHEDPRRGVVDPQCRVHGTANLYAAGSSVFPTCGHANPTLTLVALALRLADHLKSQITGRPT